MEATKKNLSPSLNTPAQKGSGPLVNLLFSLFIPILILNKLSSRLGENGALIALVIALSFPIGLGIYDLIQSRKANFFSLLGIISVLLTGGLAFFKLGGNWFAIKEAAIPLVLGLFILGSLWTKKPVIKLFFLSENFLHLDRIHRHLKKNREHSRFERLLKVSTGFLALSFFLSATLNYALASKIFIPIDPHLTAMMQASLLNDQIAQMTWKSYVVIVIPSLLFLSFILWYLFNGIKKLTGLTLEEVMKVQE